MFMIRNKLYIIMAAFIAAGLSLYTFYVFNKGQETVEKKVIIEQQENYINTRRRIDEATRSNGDVDSAIERLRLRQQNRSK
jgi:hypothetical protein